MAATIITRTADTDDDGTGTTGTIRNNAWKTALYDQIDGIFKRTVAGDLALELENTDTTSTSDTGFIARVGSGAAGDPFFQVVNGVETWTLGLDNSANDIFALSRASALGTNDVFRADSNNNFQVVNKLFVNDDANTNMTVGLTINQAGADNQIAAFKSSDVAHGITDIAETDTYAAFLKESATIGGLKIRGLTAGGSGDAALSMDGIVTTAVTTKATTATAAVHIVGRLKSGTGVASLGADANILGVGDNGTMRFFLDADGDSHQDVGTAWTTFDVHDDLALLHALSAGVSRKGDPLKRSFARLLTKHRRTLERERIVTFNKDQHHFVNWSRLNMLTIGAVRQLGMKCALLERELMDLRKQLPAAS